MLSGRDGDDVKVNADLLLRLPGTADEKNWLREHLETLSVMEWDILAAAVERSPPAAMADAVNHLLTLDKYEVCPAGSYEALGEFYLREQCVPQEQEPFFDKAALGQWYEDQHPGLFIGRHYVAYPKQEIIRCSALWEIRKRSRPRFFSSQFLSWSGNGATTTNSISGNSGCSFKRSRISPAHWSTPMHPPT